MRGSIGSSPNPLEARHRLSASTEESSKRRFQRNKDFRDVEKASHSSVQDRIYNCRFSPLKIILIITVVGTILLLLHSPSVHDAEHLSHSSSQMNIVDRWRWDSPVADRRYKSDLSIDWNHISEVIERLTDRNEYKAIGLLNFNDTEVESWQELLPSPEHIVLHLDHVPKNITWETLYPEWIDEEEDSDVPVCPSLPNVQVPRNPRLDLIAVKLPCNKASKWSRDVARLHLQLAAARLAASVKGSYDVRVLLVTECFPVPNLFTCWIV